MMSNNNGGMLTGLVGSVVFVKGKNGEAIVRSKPVYKKKKLTPKRQQSCDRFTLGGDFIKPIYPFLKEGFTNFLGKDNARDAVRSYTFKHGVNIQQGIPVIVYEQVLISTGNLRPYQAEQHHLVNNSLQLRWNPDAHQAFAQPDDVLTVLVYAPQDEHYVFFKACAQRTAGSIHLDIPAACVETGFHAWATFADATQQEYAFSTYLGSFEAV